MFDFMKWFLLIRSFNCLLLFRSLLILLYLVSIQSCSACILTVKCSMVTDKHANFASILLRLAHSKSKVNIKCITNKNRRENHNTTFIIDKYVCNVYVCFYFIILYPNAKTTKNNGNLYHYFFSHSVLFSLSLRIYIYIYLYLCNRMVKAQK